MEAFCLEAPPGDEFAGFAALRSEPSLSGQTLSPEMQALLQVASELLPPPQKGKKVASSADDEAASGASDDDAARDDDPGSPPRGTDEEPAAAGHESPSVLARSKEISELVLPHGGSPAPVSGVPMIRRCHGSLEPPVQLKVPLGVAAPKRRKLAEPTRYIFVNFEALMS